MDKLCTITDSRSLLLLEDIAQTYSAPLDGILVEVFGELTTFSLYSAKNITSGESSMISYVDAAIEHNTRLYHNQEMLQQHHSEAVGLNNRVTDTHIAIDRVQLTKVDV